MDKDRLFILVMLFSLMLYVTCIMTYELRIDSQNKQLQEYHKFKLDSLKLVKTGIVDECK
jgi:hypothetical protein